MSETTAEHEDGGEEEVAAPPRRRWSGKKIFMFLVLPVLLIGGAFQFGLLDSFLGGAEEEESAAEEEPAKDAVYFDLPDMIVNLNTTNGQPTYLKLSISLELDDEQTIAQLNKVMPRIVDRFQVYLRELRAEDISGSAGVYRLKEELLSRVNSAVQPHEVQDVLFREMLVQ